MLTNGDLQRLAEQANIGLSQDENAFILNKINSMLKNTEYIKNIDIDKANSEGFVMDLCDDATEEELKFFLCSQSKERF